MTRPSVWAGRRRDRHRDVVERKIHAMHAHETQEPDYREWIGARKRVPGLLSEEAFIREFPDAGGPPLEADLFEALRLAAVR